MQRNYLNISDYHYMIEYYETDKTLSFNYVMIRYFDFINNIAQDNTIMFIDRDTLDILKKELENSNTNTVDTIVFPISNERNTFSNTWTDFNYNFTKESFTKESEVYSILSKDKDEMIKDDKDHYAWVNVDTVRIYHPTNYKSINENTIVCIDNYINNIHFIYLCKKLSDYKSNSITEIRNNNDRYSEYIDVYIPNIKDLFSNDKYYIEDLNIITGDESINSDLNNKSFLDGRIFLSQDKQYASMDLIIQPWRLQEYYNSDFDDTTYSRLYLKKDIGLTELAYPINVTIFPYEVPNKNVQNPTNKYLPNNNLFPSSTSFILKYYFNLTCKLGFDDSFATGKVSIISTFKYSDILNPTDKNYKGSKSEYAYKKFFNINNEIYQADKYEEVFGEEVVEIKKELEKLDKIRTQQIIQGSKYEIDFNNRYSNLLNNLHLSSFQLDSIKHELYNNPDLCKINYDNDREKTIETYKFNLIAKRSLLNIDNDKNLRDIADIYKVLGIDSNSQDYRCILKYLNSRDPKETITDKGSLEIYKTQLSNEVGNTPYNRIKAYYILKLQSIVDNDESLDTTFDFIGYKIEIAKDTMFKDIVYTKYFSYKNEYNLGIQDFIFNINNILKDWKEFPDILLCRTIFLDRFTGNILSSNIIVINKEWYKYIINNLGLYSISHLSQKNDKFKNQFKNNHENNMISRSNILDIDNEKVQFNFIDKINCIVKKTSNNEGISLSSTSNNNLIYKPYFYRVSELQNIKLRTGVEQNIGINLNEYMTKTESFKLKIDGIEINEFGRNDSYVIFKVNTSLFNNTSGRYDIFDQSNNYISDGLWYTY